MFAAINRSLRYKMMAVVLATTLAALLVSTVTLLTYEVRNYRDFLVSDAATQADLLARTTAPALQFDDRQAAAENVSLLATRRGIVAAAIYAADGNIFAKYVRDNGEGAFPTLTSPHGSQFTGGTLELFHPIIENEQVIGTVYLQASYDLIDRLQDYLLILGGVMLLSLIVAGIISLRLQRSVTGPVLAVTDVARKVIEDRDFTLRARRTSNDEIGVLVDSFNTMLAEVGQRTEALEATNRRLREETEERRSAEAALRLADRRKDEFLATLAHELRNPLAPMVNSLSMMTGPGSAETAPRAQEIIQRQLAHMVRLVDDLLDVSRITRGKLAVQAQTVELAGIIQSAVDTVQPVMDARRHALIVTLPDEPIYVRGDAIRLSQVFSNLLNNAAKYSDPRGCVRLSAVTSDNRLEIVVADDGIGIAADTLPTIFEMFTQGDGSVERTQSGLGVGLALTKRLVELHGGTVEARSPGLGRGSTFTVSLPLAAAPAPAPAQQAAEVTRNSNADAARSRRILLVDDNVDFATSLAMLLEGLGHDVRIAHSGAEGIEAAADLKPEIAFLDIGLPVMSGYELAGQLRGLAAAKQTVLIALSGWGQDEDRRRSREAGFVAHLVKPVELEKIESILEAMVPDR